MTSQGICATTMSQHIGKLTRNIDLKLKYGNSSLSTISAFVHNATKNTKISTKK